MSQPVLNKCRSIYTDLSCMSSQNALLKIDGFMNQPAANEYKSVNTDLGVFHKKSY